MSKKIRWSFEERTLLQKRVNELYAENSNWEMFAALKEAQKSLPAERRRDLNSISQAPWIIKPVIQPKVIRPIKEELPQLEPTPPKSIEVQLKELLVEYVSGIVTEVLTQVRKEVISTAIEKTPKSPISIELPSKKKVYVYGLLPSQSNEIRKAFDNLLELRFGKDESPIKIKSGCQWADSVFLMTKFIPHDEYYTIKNYSNVKHINGGVSELKVELEDYFLAN